jgi:PPOX class probable F420-dependent enzyme
LYDEDGVLRLSLNTSRQKVKNMQRSPEVSFFVLDPTNPYHTLEVRARAEISEDPEGAFALKLGKKYGGADVRNNDRPGQRRVIVTLHPVKVNTWG